MEKIICKQLTTFSLHNGIIPHNQHGFLANRSMVTCLLTSLNQWTSYLDANDPIDVLYLDFEKAFNRVLHMRLLTKLEHLGIRGNPLKWIIPV